MPTDVIIVGAGGFGRETLDVIEAHNEAGRDPVHVIGVADDNPNEINLQRLEARGYRHLGPIGDVVRSCSCRRFIIAVGDPFAREKIRQEFFDDSWVPLTVIHPASTIGSLSQIANGCVVCSGVQVSTNVVIGPHTHLNPNATIGHDTVIEAFVSINPGSIISGEVHIGRLVLIGAGAVVLQGLTLAGATVIGAGAVLVRDVQSSATYVGVPARRLHLS